MSRANPVDKEKLALVHAQRIALNEELLDLAVAPLKCQLKRLEDQLKESLKTMRLLNPKNVDTQEQIAKCKAEIAAKITALTGEAESSASPVEDSK